VPANGPRRLGAPAWLLCALTLLLPTRVGGQVFKVDAGSSTLYQAEGGSISVTAGNYTSDFGIGYFDSRIQFGARLRTRLFGNDVTAGDDTVDLRLPTDVFGSSPYFRVRGLGVSRASDGNKLYVFAGSTSDGVFTPFFNAGRSDRSLAAIFEDKRLSRTVRIVSRNLFSSKATSIQAIEWSP
jgi:hypothetical protein